MLTDEETTVLNYPYKMQVDSERARFEAFTLAPSAAARLRDVVEHFTAQHARDAQRTVWVHASAQPANALDHVALQIMHAHQKRSPANSELAHATGVEYWIQSRSPGASMPFHWDKDERLRGRTGAYAYPYMSTITYLSGTGGAPTVVLDACADACGTPVGASTSVAIGTGWLSYPELGKHVCFDGRLLHGVVAEFAAPNAAPTTNRVTFLVNIWTQHTPESSQCQVASLLPRVDALLHLPLVLHEIVVPEASASAAYASFSLRHVVISVGEFPRATSLGAMQELLLQHVFCGDNGDQLVIAFGCTRSELALKSAVAICAASSDVADSTPVALPASTHSLHAYRLRLDLCVRVAMPHFAAHDAAATTWCVMFGPPPSAAGDDAGTCLCIRATAAVADA